MFDAVHDWGNLMQAHAQAARGKRGRASAAGFEHRLADRLLSLQESLTLRTYQPGAYRHFFVHEPKRRRISAAPFADRVVHHALCNVLMPVFEPHFIGHSYANRVGLGTHRALDQLQAWAGRWRYALRCDVVQHFPSLDHALLRAKIARHVHDDGVLWLVDRLLAGGADALADEYTPVYFAGDDLLAACRPRGLPIGNLTSQFWSNLYLSDMDWFVTRQLGCGAYLRYVDDFVLLADSKAALWRMRAAVIERLGLERLRLHEAQAQVVPTACGIPWLGFVVYPTHRLLKRRGAINFTRHYRDLVRAYRAGTISFAELDGSVQGWINPVRYGDTWGLREHIFGSLPLRQGRI